MAARECTASAEYLLDPSRLPTQKRCPKCERTLPAATFGQKRKTNRSGTVSIVLGAYCIDCKRQMGREHMRRVPRAIKAERVRRLRARDPRGKLVDCWYTHRGRGSDISLEEYAEHYERVRMGCKPSDWDAWAGLDQSGRPMSAEDEARRAWQTWMDTAPATWLDAYWSVYPKPWLRPGLTEAERHRIRYATDRAFNMLERVRRHFKKLGLGGMSGARMQRKLGYRPEDLRQHIERQFAKGMSWDNYGDWHIDHIVPKSSYDLSSPDEVRACWCLSNLRPLWAAENMRKGARRVYLC